MLHCPAQHAPQKTEKYLPNNPKCKYRLSEGLNSQNLLLSLFIIGNLLKKYSQLSSCYKLKCIRFTLMTNKYIYNGYTNTIFNKNKVLHYLCKQQNIITK